MNKIAQESIATTKIGCYLRLVQNFPLLGWFFKKGYAQGVFWVIMIGVVSVLNDVLMCHLGDQFDAIEVVFFRYLFSMLTVLPFMLSAGSKYFKTNQLPLHGIRALIGAIAVGLICYALASGQVPMAENTTILFSIPLFFLPMSYFFLKEKIDFARWGATILGFVGIIIIQEPWADTFKLYALASVGAAILFAFSNVIIKKMVTDEHIYTMLFYFGLGTTLLASIPLIYVWKTPNCAEIGYLFLLGIGANLIQVCIFKAFSSVRDVSSLNPYFYIEILLSVGSGYLFFGQIPKVALYYGAPLIVLSTFYIAYAESKRKKEIQ